MSRKWRHRHQENDKHRMEKPGLWRFLTSRLYGITFSLKMYRVKKIATAQGPYDWQCRRCWRSSLIV